MSALGQRRRIQMFMPAHGDPPSGARRWPSYRIDETPFLPTTTAPRPASNPLYVVPLPATEKKLNGMPGPRPTVQRASHKSAIVQKPRAH